MKKNIIIAVLGIALAGQAVFYWVIQSTTVAPELITDEAASSLATAADAQNQLCCDTTSQMAWLRKHLEKTICVLEKEYQLQPGPTQVFDYSSYTEPFVTPYEVPDCRSLNLETDALKTNIGLQRLAALLNLRVVNATMINTYMEGRIEDFYKRLKRLEPLLEQEN